MPSVAGAVRRTVVRTVLAGACLVLLTVAAVALRPAVQPSEHPATLEHAETLDALHASWRNAPDMSAAELLSGWEPPPGFLRRNRAGPTPQLYVLLPAHRATAVDDATVEAVTYVGAYHHRCSRLHRERSGEITVTGCPG